MQEGLNDFQPLGQFLGLGLRGGFGKILTKLGRQRLEIHTLQKLLYGFGTHTGIKVRTVKLNRFIVGLFCHERSHLELGQTGVSHDICLKIQDPLDFADRHVQQYAQTGRQRFQEPDVRHGAREFDMTHPLAANSRQRHFDAAFFTDHTAVLEPFVLSAQAFVVLHRAKQFCAEKAIALGFECPVVDGFGLLDFAEGPRTNLVRRRQPDSNIVKLLVYCIVS